MLVKEHTFLSFISKLLLTGTRLMIIRYIPEGHTDFALVQHIQAYDYITRMAIVTVFYAITNRIL